MTRGQQLTRLRDQLSACTRELRKLEKARGAAGKTLALAQVAYDRVDDEYGEAATKRRALLSDIANLENTKQPEGDA
jgi:chromosome segregation ATPase